ncbi:DUF2627 domain-containing protein [Paenibacillus sp. N3/727]|uniref:DUF2627 domain-containing protein n=1 Tax=Paenibacillus sp. N3/727 TaxID=2925845 RepID=UPI001F52CC29|nr:DUF2627 domain-containing protein [Paenibacillus sp. N3/727]UNK20411.1 DUF2627 domain-containing protein [Paenibacillus sp. N3/727]
MKLLISRFIAILILVIPGFMAMTGFLMMKDAVFLYIAVHGNDQITNPSFQWLHFGGGLLLFVLGIGFLGGWILFRDRKRNYVGPRFKKKRPSNPDAPTRT